MKKKLLAILLFTLLLCSLSATAFADTIPAGDGWQVTFNSKEKMESNFSTDSLADTLSNLQPGDDTTFTISTKNNSSQVVDWYMLNSILETLEDESTNGAENGGYTYRLTYKTSGGSEREFYNSNRVGGGGQEGYTTGAEHGLKEIDASLKNYMFLERMNPGGSGTVTLYVALDGESQDNRYQDTAAMLQLRFAVEVVPTQLIVTGDNPVKLSPVYIGMAISGVVVLLLAIDGAVRNARKRKEPKA